MHWIILAACSALFLGVYDYFKKRSVNQNAVLPVLFFANLVGALIWTPVLLFASELRSSWLPSSLIPEPLGFTDHAYIIAKSALVSCAWMLSYFALKALPLSIAAPIRATSPVWTLMIAIGVLGESPTSTQLIGITLTLGAFWYFSSGKRDDLEKEHDPRWILAMVGATLINACSGIYDKYLLQHLEFSPATVQAWFSIYLAVIMLPLYLGWLAGLWNRRSPFRWKWSIPMIAISLLCADFIYFTAMHQPGALVSVITPIRRCSVIISFLIGILILKESSSRRKILGLAGILTGVIVIFLGN
ncbi:MAG: EamA family transporter [Verrucomicrobiota bacterium]